jgi:hypothetical protein
MGSTTPGKENAGEKIADEKERVAIKADFVIIKKITKIQYGHRTTIYTPRSIIPFNFAYIKDIT